MTAPDQLLEVVTGSFCKETWRWRQSPGLLKGFGEGSKCIMDTFFGGGEREIE